MAKKPVILAPLTSRAKSPPPKPVEKAPRRHDNSYLIQPGKHRAQIAHEGRK